MTYEIMPAQYADPGWGGYSSNKVSFSPSVDQDAVHVFEPMECDFPNHKDKLEGLVGHFRKVSPLSAS